MTTTSAASSAYAQTDTLVLGVDAGNTKTIAIVARLSGEIVGWGRAGCGDIYLASSMDAALAAIEGAALIALQSAGASASSICAGAFSLAGADWPEDFDLLRAEMVERGLGGLHGQVRIVNDAIGALRAGSLDGCHPAVVVACGTGAAIAARGYHNKVWHTSFWQEPQGAGDLGDQTLRAVYRAELGIDGPTTLTARVLAYFGQSSVEDLLHGFTARVGPSLGSTARLARLLLDEAANGDATARRIVQTHGASLGDYALAAARHVGIRDTPFTLYLAGGVLRHPARLLSQAIINHIRQVAPQMTAQDSRFEPAIGALLLALELADIVVDQKLASRLIPTIPSGELFTT